MHFPSLLILSLSFLSPFFPTILAGPACARRKQNTADCIAQCSQHWGWPGSTFGIDPWGSVLSPSSSATTSMPPLACGAEVQGGVSQGNSSDSPSPAVVNPAENPPPVPDATPIYYSYGSPSPSPLSSNTNASSLPVLSPASNPSPHASQAPKSQSTIPQRPATTPHTSPRPPPISHTTTTSPPKETPQSPPSPPPQEPSSSGSSTSNSDISQYLKFHNTVRAQHGAAALTWNNEAAAKAQQWANGCEFHHSGGTLGPLGENLAAGSGNYGIENAVTDWTNEASSYDPNNPVASHFTQVVWKGTTSVGCAVQSCNGIFAASFGPANYYVCEYSPPGNVEGEFPQNVQV